MRIVRKFFNLRKKDGFFYVIANLIVRLSNSLYFFLIANFFPLDIAGEYSWFLGIFNVINTMTFFGSDVVMLKNAGIGTKENEDRLLIPAFFIRVVLSLGTIAIVYPFIAISRFSPLFVTFLAFNILSTFNFSWYYLRNEKSRRYLLLVGVEIGVKLTSLVASLWLDSYSLLLIGLGVSPLFYVIDVRKRIFVNPWNHVRRMKAILLRSKNIGISRLFTIAHNYVDVILVGMFVTYVDLGKYSIATKIINLELLPFLLLVPVLQKKFFKTYSQKIWTFVLIGCFGYSLSLIFINKYVVTFIIRTYTSVEFDSFTASVLDSLATKPCLVFTSHMLSTLIFKNNLDKYYLKSTVGASVFSLTLSVLVLTFSSFENIVLASLGAEFIMILVMTTALTKNTSIKPFSREVAIPIGIGILSLAYFFIHYATIN